MKKVFATSARRCIALPLVAIIVELHIHWRKHYSVWEYSLQWWGTATSAYEHCPHPTCIPLIYEEHDAYCPNTMHIARTRVCSLVYYHPEYVFSSVLHAEIPACCTLLNGYWIRVIWRNSSKLFVVSIAYVFWSCALFYYTVIRAARTSMDSKIEPNITPSQVTKHKSLLLCPERCWRRAKVCKTSAVSDFSVIIVATVSWFMISA